MNDKFNQIKELIEQHPDAVQFGEFGQGVSNEWIKKAEDRLNVYFPKSFVWWLKNYSGGEIFGNEIFSIYELDFDNVVGGDIVYMNELNRKNGICTKEQLTILENDQGEMYYFDLNQSNNEGESPIFCDITNKKYADDFIDFLRKQIICIT
tara:strand:+ start:3954 stop:4406 length:453 start_codon:yes stop_codon:yes gene_type:complete